MTLIDTFREWFRRGIETKDLGKAMDLNTKGVGGTSVVLPVPPFSNIIENGFDFEGDNSFGIFYSLIATVKNWHINQFNYKNLPKEIDADYIEYLLFIWGKVAVIKWNEKLYTLPFFTHSWDTYYNPKSVRIIVPYMKNHTLNDKLFIVGENCELIYNDQSYLLGSKVFWGTLWRIYPYLKGVVKAWNLIKRNQDLSKKWIKVPFDMPLKQTEQIEKEIQNDKSFILRLQNDFLLPSTSSQNQRGEQDKLEFEDNTGEKWDDYYNLLNELKSVLGMDSNANSNKRERQITDEIEVNNTMANSMLQIQIKQRKKAVEKINASFKLKITVELQKELDEQENEKKMLAEMSAQMDQKPTSNEKE